MSGEVPAGDQGEATLRFEQRGIVEGYYGTPWSPAARRAWVGRLARLGLNRFLIAPKDDPLQRERWRDAYPSETLAEFAALVEQGEREGVRVGFGISPGLSIRYAAPEDRRALAAKLGALRERGARCFALALDDTPSQLRDAADRRAYATLAQAHVDTAHALRDALGPDSELTLVPMDYAGCHASDYLHELGESLAPEIGVAWSGRCVVSPTIEAPEAAQRAALLRRRLVLWDNVPVNDGPMRILLPLGPYAGRDPALAEPVCGVWLNVMERPAASALTVATAAAYLDDPFHYQPERAWQEATARVGEGAPEAFRLFAAAHRFGPLWPEDRDAELERGLTELRVALEADRDVAPALDHLDVLLAARLEVADALRSRLADRDLVREIEPWIEAHHVETLRMSFASKALRQGLGDAPALERCLALIRLEGRLTRQPPAALASYGARRLCVPQLVDVCEPSARFGADPALIRDASLADALIGWVEEVLLTRCGGEERRGARP